MAENNSDYPLVRYPLNLSADTPNIIFTARKWVMPSASLTSASPRITKGGTVFKCALYAPAGLAFSNGADWGPTKSISYNVLGAAADRLGTMAGATVSGMTKNMGTLGTGVGAAIVNVPAEMAMNAGVAAPPMEIKLYTGNSFQDFSVEFTMTPIESKEAEVIKQIARGFERAIKPSIVPDGVLAKVTGAVNNAADYATNKMKEAGVNVGAGLIALNYPNTFDIICRSGAAKSGKRTKSAMTLFSYQNMALTSFRASFSDGQESLLVFDDGHPVQVKMSLTFSAIEKGYNGSNGIYG